MHGATIKMA